MVFGIQDDVFHAPFAKHLGDLLRFFNRGSADQNWTACLILFGDFFNRSLPLFRFGTENHVGQLVADQRLVSGYFQYVEVVDFVKFWSLSYSRTRHAGEFVVHSEKILKCDRSESLILLRDLDALFSLDCLMKAVAPSSAWHHAASELIDNNHLAVFQEVVSIALKQGVRLNRLLDVVDQVHMGGIIEIVYTEKPF